MCVIARVLDQIQFPLTQSLSEFWLGLVANSTSRQLASTSPTNSDSRKELDSLISSLVGDKSTTGYKKSSTPEGLTGDNSASATPANRNEVGKGAPSSHPPVQPQSLSFAPLTILVEKPAATRAEYITYNRGVQTGDAYWGRRDSDSSAPSDDDFPYADGRRTKRLSRKEKEKEAEQLREKIRHELEKEIEAKQAEIDAASREVAEQEAISARLLPEEETKVLMAEEYFMGFVGRASKVIERALDEDYDILADYASRSLGLDEDDEDGYSATRGKSARGIKELIQFYDERWSKKRMISDLNFSPKV